MQATNSSSASPFETESMGTAGPDDYPGGVGTPPTVVRKESKVSDETLDEAIDRKLKEAVDTPMTPAEIEVFEKKIKTIQELKKPS